MQSIVGGMAANRISDISLIGQPEQRPFSLIVGNSDVICYFF